MTNNVYIYLIISDLLLMCKLVGHKKTAWLKNQAVFCS